MNQKRKAAANVFMEQQQLDEAQLIAFARRLPWGRGYALSLRKLAQARPGESQARRLNRCLEDLIRECPGQYLWGYNRYKTPAGAEKPQ